MKLKAALILDDLRIAKWQKDALDFASKKLEITIILNCKNSKTNRNYIKNFFYYCVNFFSLRNKLTKKSKYRSKNSKIFHFNSIYKGIWQHIPYKIKEKIKSEKIDVIIKFGMNILFIDEDQNLPPILSFHHGDPSKFRGRPAGFYEILNNQDKVGIIVQQLNNQLDAGRILAFAETKVINFSYKKTSISFYEKSKYLLSKSIDNLIKKNEIKLNKNGHNYHLPNNYTVCKFIIKTTFNAICKIFYGLFYEKKWKVAILANTLSFRGAEKILSKKFVKIPMKRDFNFYADPFFSEDGKYIRLEALRSKSGLGDIIEININNFLLQKKIFGGSHYSYPFSFIYNSNEYILPEVESHSSQYICSTNNLNEKFTIKGIEDKQVVDSTLFEKDNKWFLFFGEKESADTVLNLWYSDSPFNQFKAHPQSPIKISPSGARMGGKILKLENQILRFGQNNSKDYGESLIVYEIKEISTNIYNEKEIGSLRIDSHKGPHTLGLNLKSNQILLDYYDNKFSFYSGIRRLKAKLKRKRIFN